MDDAELDEALRALAHPARRAAIRLTAHRDVPASTIATALRVAPATASEHLKVLRKTGFVRLTAQGTWRRYRADLQRVRHVRAALAEHLSTVSRGDDNMSAEIAHFEIAGPDDQALATFYEQLLSWPVDQRGPGYTLLRPEVGPGGAVIEAEHPRVTLGVTVANLRQVVDRVEALGGQVLMPPTDNGWVTKALVRDPAGNELSLIQASVGPADAMSTTG